MDRVRRRKIFLGGVLGVFLVLLGVNLVRAYFLRTEVREFSMEVAEEKTSVEYLKVKLEAKILLEYRFRTLGAEELLSELKAIEDKIQDIVGELEGDGEPIIARTLLKDSGALSRELGGAEEVLKAKFEDEADRQLELMGVVARFAEEENVKFYISRVVFDKEVEDLSKTEAFLLNGADIVLESGGGRINVFLGGEGIVGLVDEEVESIMIGGEVFGVSSGTGEMAKLAESLDEILEVGRLKTFGIDFLNNKIVQTDIKLKGKATWDLREELDKRGIRGLVGENLVENNIPVTLIKILEELKEE